MTSDHPPEDQIGAFLDHELPELEAQAVAAHLNGCAACSALAADIQMMSATLSAVRPTVPDRLRASVRAALAAETEATRRPGFGGRLVDLWSRWLDACRQTMIPAVSSAAFVALVSASATWMALGQGPAPSLIAHDLVTAHLRALAQNGAIQVASSDQHTVKPWFAGKVDFSPEARDLSAEGFMLVGGRLDVIDGRRVGALVYKRRLHVIDVFAWPAGSPAPTPAGLRMERGYGLLTWTKAGVVYWAVSDLDPVELKRFADLL